MRKPLLIFTLFLAAALASACLGGGDSADGFDPLGLTDETEKAVALVDEANTELKKIKELFKTNEGRLKELQSALAERDTEKVKELSHTLVYQINDGMALGEDAIAKINDAQQLKINDDFREYLSLKELSLKKYIEAFQLRHESARLLRDGYNPTDKNQREIVVSEFRAREDRFKEIMEEARRFSERANLLAKESSQKKRE